jgi:hypothetical protein
MSSICVVDLLIGFLFSKNSISPDPLFTSGSPTADEDSSTPAVVEVCPVTVSPFEKSVYPVLLFCV